ncbi:MAG TPA: efflux RND transporter permease subunit [Candidatus Paceibacterota bacterium]|nr:efflux RND transporter permease subunit [Candidatus Paceibacterota bacterium]
MIAIWKFFLEKRRFTLLLIAALVLWGSIAAIKITKESAPEVSIPVGIVTTVLPGASAADVERLVTDKMEEHLANIENLDTLTSTSRDGISSVVVQFLASADLDKSIATLKDDVDKAKPDLPAEAQDPIVSDVNFVDQPVLIISVSADQPFAQLAELGDTVKDELQTVPGVSRVDVSGVRNREIDIVVRKAALAQYGLSLPQITSAIAAANSSLPVGQITVDNVNYNIAFEGSFDTVSDIGSVAILNVGGQVIYLRDIADVSDGVEEATSYSRVSVSGKPSEQAMTLLVYKVRGQDVTTVTKAVRAKLADLQSTTLSGSQVVVSLDAGDEVETDLTELTRTGLETMALVMLALFATIGWREAVVAGLSIPLSFLIAFIGLLYSGNTLNFVSLFSLILAIGILVDSGIVVVEAIHTRIRKFGNKEVAAVEAVREYGWPLMGGTLATVSFFVPLFFISGIVGKFIASIPFTLIFVLVASIVVALGLVPTLAILFSHTEHDTPFLKLQEEYAEKARAWYADKLRRFFAHRAWQNRFLWGMTAAFILALMLPMLGLLQTTFFPQGDSDYLYADIELPPGSSLGQSDLAAREVEEILYNDPNIASFVTEVGASSEFGNNPQSDPRFANLTINLPKDRKESSTDILQNIRKELSVITDAKITADEPSGGPPVGAAIDLKFMGDDQDSLDQAVAMARSALEATPGATNIDATNKNETTEFTLTIDRAKLAQVGLSPAIVASTLRTAVSGTKATSISGTDQDVDVNVYLDLNPDATDPHQNTNTTLDSLNQIPVPTPSGDTVLLGSLLEEGITRNNSVINHEDRKKVVELTADTLPGYTAGGVLAAYQHTMDDAKLPAGVTSEVAGENEQTNESFIEMGYALLAGVALTFFILVLAFNSYRFAGYLLMLVPLSLIGVFGGLFLTAQTLSFSSLLGVIALAGVIINHAIILMDSIIQRIKVGNGRALTDIIVEAAVSRLRPIVLTTVTTVIGMIPLTYASALWGPLAFAILFGLSFAMILTLVLIPTLVYRWPGRLPDGIIREPGKN